VPGEHLDGDYTTDSEGSPEPEIRSMGDPRREFLNALDAVREEIDAVVADFPMDRPTSNAALQLTKTIRTLYETIKLREQNESPSIKEDLSILRDYALDASIAMPRLTGDDRPVETMRGKHSRPSVDCLVNDGFVLVKVTFALRCGGLRRGAGRPGA
jgi:hypothetical protein